MQERRIMQIGYVVKDIERSIRDYAQRLNLGPWDLWTFSTPELQNAMYKGKPIEHSFIIALAWNQTTQLELIQPLEGRNIYTDHLERRGEGLHHVKEWVDNCQQELEFYHQRGVEVLQCGKFGDDEHYYLDTEPELGFVYEIGNNQKIRPPDRRLG